VPGVVARCSRRWRTLTAPLVTVSVFAPSMALAALFSESELTVVFAVSEVAALTRTLSWR